jgi:hypothetical protein
MVPISDVKREHPALDLIDAGSSLRLSHLYIFIAKTYYDCASFNTAILLLFSPLCSQGWRTLQNSSPYSINILLWLNVLQAPGRPGLSHHF